MTRHPARVIFTAFLLAVVSCGGSSTDGEGLSGSETAMEQFTRASQLYFRGRLTASLDEFNGVIYRFPESPFAADARLAARRVESDLSGENIVSSGGPSAVRIESRVAVVGRAPVTANVNRTAELLSGICPSISGLVDHQAPEITMVFHTLGCEEDASVVADSLGRWFLRPEEITLRPGEELIDAVAPGFDVLVIIGNDAVFEPSVN